MKKSIVAGTIATVIGGLILFFIQNYFFSQEREGAQLPQGFLASPATISITGSNNSLNIIKTNFGALPDYVNITGNNLSREISIGSKQFITLDIVGSHNDIVIEKSVFPNVLVKELGSDNSVTRSLW